MLFNSSRTTHRRIIIAGRLAKMGRWPEWIVDFDAAVRANKDSEKHGAIWGKR